MKKQLLLSLILLLIFHFSLNSQNLPFNLDIKKIIGKAPEVDSTLLADVEYIFLETNENCLIGSMALDIRCVNGYFYINDLMRSHSILVFNKSGKFEYKISKYGRGPGEYSNANKFDVDAKGNIYVLNNILGSGNNYLIKYSEKGTKYSTIDLGCKTADFMIIDGVRALITSSFYPVKSKFCIGELNLKDKSVKEILPFRDYYDNATFHLGSGSFFRSENTVYFTPYFSNVIYRAKQKNIELFAQFDISFIPPQAVIKNFKSGADFGRIMREGNYIYSIDHVFETSDMLTISILHNKGSITYLFSKKTSKDHILNYNSFNDTNYFGQNLIIGTIGDYLVSNLPSWTYMSADWKDKVNSSSLDEITKEKLLSLGLTTNPVLILYKIKPF